MPGDLAPRYKRGVSGVLRKLPRVLFTAFAGVRWVMFKILVPMLILDIRVMCCGYLLFHSTHYSLLKPR